MKCCVCRGEGAVERPADLYGVDVWIQCNECWEQEADLREERIKVNAKLLESGSVEERRAAKRELEMVDRWLQRLRKRLRKARAKR